MKRKFHVTRNASAFSTHCGNPEWRVHGPMGPNFFFKKRAHKTENETLSLITLYHPLLPLLPNSTGNSREGKRELHVLCILYFMYCELSDVQHISSRHFFTFQQVPQETTDCSRRPWFDWFTCWLQKVERQKIKVMSCLMRDGSDVWMTCNLRGSLNDSLNLSRSDKHLSWLK
jgi:hypothetical protein